MMRAVLNALAAPGGADNASSRWLFVDGHDASEAVSVARQMTCGLSGFVGCLPVRCLTAGAELGVPGQSVGLGLQQPPPRLGGLGSIGRFSVDHVVRGPMAVSVRGFYFPRKNWFPWRVRLVHQRQAALRRKRHIWPRRKDGTEAAIFGEKEDGSHLIFRDKELRLSLRRLTDIARLMRGRHLQDAIDWIESLSQMKSQVIVKFLRKSLKEATEKHRRDPARLYVYDAQPQFGSYIKSIRKMRFGNYGIVKSPRHKFEIRVREMPLEEYFHRIYIYGKVPRSLASDMRLALHERRVSQQMVKEWSPYLSSHSRLFHRKELKWLDSTRQFDYYQERREWIHRYRANLLRASSEAREARGLPPLTLAD